MCGEWIYGYIFEGLIIFPPTQSLISLLYFQQLVLENWFSRKESFVALRKDLENWSLQVGKDYWEPEDWNTTFPKLVEWSKRWVEVLINENERNGYWIGWHTQIFTTTIIKCLQWRLQCLIMKHDLPYERYALLKAYKIVRSYPVKGFQHPIRSVLD